ncbi:MAG: selenocysteine-specific translation elongation factor [Pleurocapsa minor GSE-CHR-MK-17-07R]|jgi:selenocysteine-specific elongation factor|nr:selenocysteine-specific translation elongation factor [Pleurocapsa minor GSE-CHR-MK 17-07R]
MRVVATAGHVDHGKSSLVQRLTGTDPDRLAEEKARGMTIDLGFALWSLPDGEHIGLIDVPGHRDFIGNMLAGVGGIDAALLIVAADEGVMPQTAEHLAILDLLGVEHGIVVITKCDLVDDEMVALVMSEVHDRLAGTALKDAPMVAVSARTGMGIDHLNQEMMTLVSRLPTDPAGASVRLSVDRVFTLTGFGTVVTGTLLGGSLSVGDQVTVYPEGLSARIRGLHHHGQPVQTASPGQRTAVNLTGVEKAQLRRGQTIGMPNTFSPTTRLTAWLRCLPDAPFPIRHNAQVRLFHHAADVLGRVRLVEGERLEPDAEAWAQIELEQPIVATFGDRFVLRMPSPEYTLGGGILYEAQSPRRIKRGDVSKLQQLDSLRTGSENTRLIEGTNGTHPVTLEALRKSLGIAPDKLNAELDAALSAGRVYQIAGDRFWSANAVNQLVERMVTLLTAFHQANPLRASIPREELRQALGIDNAVLLWAVEHFDLFTLAPAQKIALASHTIQFSHEQQGRADALMAALLEAPSTPPSPTECAQRFGEDVLLGLTERGEVTRISPEVLFATQAYESFRAEVLRLLFAQGELSTATVRDLLGTSRKYAIALLEHMDAIGLTRRAGDLRVAGHQATQAAPPR